MRLKKKRTKKIASSLLLMALTFGLGLSSLSPTMVRALDEETAVESSKEKEAITVNQEDTKNEITENTENTSDNSVAQTPSEDEKTPLPSDDETSSEENSEVDGVGTLQVIKSAKDLTMVSDLHNLESVFAIYTDSNDEGSYLTETRLTVSSNGYSNVVELPVGTYYLREVEVSGGFLPHYAPIEVVIEKDKLTVQNVEVEAVTINPIFSTFSGQLGKTYTAGHAYDSGMSRPGNPGWHYMGSKSHDNSVFCVQPGVILGDGQIYKTTTTRPYYLSADMIKRMEIINYYAMKYKSYDWRTAYAVAQSMIWEIVHSEGTDSSINDMGSTKDYYYMKIDGTRVDKTAEWTEVKANIAKHTTKPSFNAKTYDVEIDTPYKLSDSNSVLSKYTFDKVEGVKITKSGNSVTFTVTDDSLINQTVKIPYTFYADSKDGKTLFYNYQYDDMSTYYGAGYQKCAEFYVKDAVTGYVNLKIGGQGELEILKSSNNTSMTNGNNAYSLAGAEYSVYTDNGCTNKVGTLTTNAQGQSNVLTLTAGTYYIKETKAPKGYALDSTVHQVAVTSGQKTTFRTTDKCQNDPVGVLLEKKDASTNQSVPVKNGSLANAQFTFKFYAGEYGDGVNPASLGVSPTRTWVMRTNVNGYTRLDNSFKVSGDELYIVDGFATLPIGTLTIQETKAPIGYHLNNEIFVRRITSSGFSEIVNTYNAPIIPENAIRFHIVKYEKGSNTAVAGVQFTHTLPNGSTETVTTNSQGKIELTGLAQGKHQIVEKSTIDGLVVNPHVFEFTINADGSITNNTSDLANKLLGFTTDATGNGVLTVYNDFADFNIRINKINNKDLKLAGAVFTLYRDSNCTNVVEELTSDENGTLTFKNLDVDTTYYLRETKAPKGYRLPVDSAYQLITHTIKIKEVSAVKGIFTFEVDGQTYTVNNKTGTIHLEGTPDNYIIDMTVTNQILTQLPATGSTSGLFAVMIIFPMLMIITGIIIKDKDKRKQLKTSNR